MKYRVTCELNRATPSKQASRTADFDDYLSALRQVVQLAERYDELTLEPASGATDTWTLMKGDQMRFRLTIDKAETALERERRYQAIVAAELRADDRP